MIDAKAEVGKFIAQLIPYDYALFAGVLVTFLVLLFLAIILYRKLFLAITLIVLAFLILILGPTLGYKQMHKEIFKNEVIVKIVKRLEFTKGVVVSGDIKNISKRDFDSCEVDVEAYKVSEYPFVTKLYKFNPFKTKTIDIKTPLLKGESMKYKVILEPFYYTKDFNVSVEVNCR